MRVDPGLSTVLVAFIGGACTVLVQWLKRVGERRQAEAQQAADDLKAARDEVDEERAKRRAAEAQSDKDRRRAIWSETYNAQLMRGYIQQGWDVPSPVIPLHDD